MLLLKPKNWDEYELIDSGDGEKLERYGEHILARPEPQAIWNKSLPNEEWTKLATATFKRDSSAERHSDNEKGQWIVKPGMKEQWHISYKYKQMNLKFRLGLTAFKHIGIFPEQAENWNYIYDTITELNTYPFNALNLFAYTGGATLAAKAAGAEVTHVDSVKQVINWAGENMKASNLDNVRWIVDDALKFAAREVRRSNQYNAIILDPPAYGRGPDGEKWILEKNLNELLNYCASLLKPTNSFLLINLYSMGFSSIIAETIIKSKFEITNCEFGELYTEDKLLKKLPLGVFLRFKRC